MGHGDGFDPQRLAQRDQALETGGAIHRPRIDLYAPSNTGNVPNTTGYMAEIAYLPFGTGKAPYWPWFNTRIGAQYFYYTKFDGDTLAPHDKNTFIIYSTILF